jgi:hypothetical protein
MFQQIKVMKKSKSFALPMVAIVIAAFSISLMSFKSSNNQSYDWYNVSFNPSTSQHDVGSSTTAPGPSDDCNIGLTGDMCKIAVPQGVTPPSHVENDPDELIKQQAFQREE